MSENNELVNLEQSLFEVLVEKNKPVTIAEVDIEEFISSDLVSFMKDMQQSRSNFQIDHFVVNQHDTDEMRFVQCLLEIQTLRTTIRTSQLGIKKTQIEINKLLATGDEVDAIDAEIKKIHLQDTLMISAGAIRELAYLLKIYDSFPKKFTRKEIEKAQEDYWTKRLVRQAELDLIGNRGTVNPAHLDALRQIGQLENVLGLAQVGQEIAEPDKKEIL
jgi:hypothetical protein